jgi:hypothetical protein
MITHLPGGQHAAGLQKVRYWPAGLDMWLRTINRSQWASGKRARNQVLLPVPLRSKKKKALWGWFEDSFQHLVYHVVIFHRKMTTIIVKSYPQVKLKLAKLYTTKQFCMANYLFQFLLLPGSWGLMNDSVLFYDECLDI